MRKKQFTNGCKSYKKLHIWKYNSLRILKRQNISAIKLLITMFKIPHKKLCSIADNVHISLGNPSSSVTFGAIIYLAIIFELSWTTFAFADFTTIYPILVQMCSPTFYMFMVVGALQLDSIFANRWAN